MMTAVSLFAGVGGFDLALERAGVKVAASVEIDKHARSVLEKHFPNTKLFNDVCEVKGNDLRDAGFIPNRGILVGGFPCQDLSVAGKRAGLDGARSGLYWEIIRLIDETQVEWVILENVPGLLSSQRGADMGAVVGALADRGYCVGWRVLDAQYFGVPQRRRRVFIVARRSGNPESIGQVLFERKSLRGDHLQGRATGQEIANSIWHGFTGSNKPLIFVKAKRAQSSTDDETWKPDVPHPTLNQFDQGDSRTVAAIIEPNGKVRRLTPLECERLQGFPDNWTEGQADSHRYKQMGNAVAVPVVQWLIDGVVGVINNEERA